MSNNPEASPGQATSAGLLPDTYQDLHNSDEVNWAVQRSYEHVPNDPHQRVATYLGSLVGRHGLLGGSEERRQAQVAHHVMDPEDIPESYFDRQREIARQQGQGDIEITEDMKQQHTEALIADQTASLNAWAEYLNDPEADYPAWFRYYTMRNVLKLADYDKEKERFRKRSQTTTAPYPELNREALAYVYERLNRRLEDQNQDNEQLQQLADQANFNKLYSHALAESVPSDQEQLQTTAGEWTKYDQLKPWEKSDRAHQLAQSLQGYGTGWCTAGKKTAEWQLEAGDFHVYYSYDEEGQPIVPRVAVRMQKGRVAEVRGIDADQNLEPAITDIAMERIQDLPGGEEYLQAAEDMNRVTDIENRVRQGEELTAQDIYFLREYGGPIQSFGYGKDPRIDELLRDRDLSADMDMMLENFDHAELAQDLMDSGEEGMDTLAQNLDKFHPDALDQAEFARDLMNRGLEYILAANLDKFPEGAVDHAKFARDLMERKLVGGEILAANLDKFPDGAVDPARLARRLVVEGRGHIVAQNLEKFPDGAVDHAQVARHLLESGEGGPNILVQNLDKFPDGAVNRVQLARDLIDRGRTGMVILANNLDKFPEGAVDQVELAHGLLESGPRGQHHLVENLEKFPPEAVDPNQIARHLMNEAGEHIFAENLDKFLQSEAIDQFQLVRDMMDSGVAGAQILADNLDKFQPKAVDQAELVRNLLKSSPSGQKVLAENLDKFLQSEAIDQFQLAQELIDSGGDGMKILANNLDKFPEGAVDPDQLTQDMLESGENGQSTLAEDKFL
ncbi:hypothetical protein BRC19_02425 [Candidatus Saccharibacteria bacterium QS_5_54_17]|nr:MAG: hypothetical protein BRC19_02425 [Candidatus Saccharibacteria bacterium QS_5_54_17]